jgi:hypothetical protein
VLRGSLHPRPEATSSHLLVNRCAFFIYLQKTTSHTNIQPGGEAAALLCPRLSALPHASSSPWTAPPSTQLADILPKLSSEQRQAIRDIDLWQKDTIDPEAANYWLEVYSKCQDELVQMEFIKSEDFLLAIKNQLTISTFDVEDPMYPDDDYYFLTEDNQLLIAYPEDFALVQELKEMVRKLYADIGVENAYAFLFKMIVDSYQIMEENNYQQKKERLRDFGFVDYFDSLEYNASFLSLDAINNFIKNKTISQLNILI